MTFIPLGEAFFEVGTIGSKHRFLSNFINGPWGNYSSADHTSTFALKPHTPLNHRSTWWHKRDHRHEKRYITEYTNMVTTSSMEQPMRGQHQRLRGEHRPMRG